MATWIDFRELRSQLRFADVLRHYKVELKVKGDHASGFCPLPGHQSKREGKKRSPSFSAHLVKGIFHCFSCHGRGNLIDFALIMDGLNPDDPQHVRQTAVKLQELFVNAPSPSNGSSARPASKKMPDTPSNDAKVIVNAPLDFELKHLDRLHPYLGSRGFKPETIEHFGLGFCQKGMMKDRIAIPLHDETDTLIGYAGRLVDDSQISNENPKYRFPGSRERDGIRYEFHKSNIMYWATRIVAPVNHLIVVKGFPSVWWMFQLGYHNSGGLMGSDCATEQGALIVERTEPNALITILTDGDDAGFHCAHSIFNEVAPHRRVRWAKLKLGKQPTDLSSEELGELLPEDN